MTLSPVVDLNRASRRAGPSPGRSPTCTAEVTESEHEREVLLRRALGAGKLTGPT